MNSTPAIPLLLTGALAACGAPEGPSRAQRPAALAFSAPCPSQSEPGIDVSSYQGSIDWSKVAGSGVRFAFAKATEGLTVKDAEFANNWSKMKQYGVLRGAYHFFHPQDDGAAQADTFLATVGTLGEAGDLPPVLDWEVTDSQTTAVQIAQAQKFIAEIEAKTGLPTILYTYPSFWTGLGSPAQFDYLPLWMAEYPGSVTSCPAPFQHWSSWTFWQWEGDDNSGDVPGVTGQDMNLFAGSLAELRAWATPPSAQASGNEALTAVTWPDGHAELFGQSAGGAALHTVGVGGSWSAPEALDTGALCGSAAAMWGAPWSYAELVSPLAGGGSGDLFWSGGSWNTYQPFGGSGLAHFSSAVGMDGQVRVFALGADSAIWLNAFSTQGGGWSGWTSLGGAFATGAGAITWGNGTIELFATNPAGAVWHAWTQPGGWSSWAQMGSGMSSRPVPVRWADSGPGHTEVFVRGADDRLYHAEYSLQSGWPAFSTLSADAIDGEPSAIMNPSGTGAPGPEVFARDRSGQVVHLTRSGTSYTDFAPLGSQAAASDPFGWLRADGTADVFAVDPQGALVHSARDSSGAWGGWAAIGSGFDSCTPAGAPDGGTADAGAADAGGDDAGVDDGGAAADAGEGSADAGTPDGGGPDAGAPDAGTQGGHAQPPNAMSAGCSGSPAGVPAAAAGLLLLLWRLSRRRADARG